MKNQDRHTIRTKRINLSYQEALHVSSVVDVVTGRPSVDVFQVAGPGACGLNLTPKEAERLAAALLTAAKTCRAKFAYVKETNRIQENLGESILA